MLTDLHWVPVMQWGFEMASHWVENSLLGEHLGSHLAQSLDSQKAVMKGHQRDQLMGWHWEMSLELRMDLQKVLWMARHLEWRKVQLMANWRDPHWADQREQH